MFPNSSYQVVSRILVFCLDLESKPQHSCKNKKAKTGILWSHKAPQVTGKAYSRGENRGPKRKRKTSEEMGTGHRGIDGNNNNTGWKIGGGPFAVS